LRQNGSVDSAKTMTSLQHFFSVSRRGQLVALALSSMAFFGASASASELCTQLPASLQQAGVAHITTAAELQALDEQIEPYMQRCLAPLNSDNTKAICSHARLAAEQALRLIGRLDTAGKHNAFLANAKLKSYKSAVALLERGKKLAADHACQP
jgi:hypothetical protein